MKKSSLTLLLAPIALSAAAQAQEQEPKNLVLVFVDQWRGDALGFLGRETPVQTPNLDRFASESVAITECASGYPVSSPARAMLMTGAYPKYNGVTINCYNGSAEYDVELKDYLDTWSDVLDGEGYALGYIGKWHLDAPREPYVDTPNNRNGQAWNEWCPPERRHGFDYWVAYGTYDNHTRPMYWQNPKDRDDWSYVDQWGPEFEVDRAIEFIGENKENPFAVVVSINPPHTGYELVPDKYKEIYKDMNLDSIVQSRPNVSREDFFRTSLPDYYACMTGVDVEFGRLMDYLRSEGLMENTIVMFTADHGDMMGTHDMIGKNVIYEESIHVPMIIGGAGLEPRMDNELLMSLEDFTPTILGMMGYEDKIPSTVQTRNLSKQVAGSKEDMPTSQLYMRMWGKGNNAVRGLRNLQYSYQVQWVDGEKRNESLFDRVNDPFQMKDVAKENPEICEAMYAELIERLKANGDNIYEIKHNGIFDYDVRENYQVGVN